jgi:membrane protein implicated in regulation of membrane protease activity
MSIALVLNVALALLVIVGIVGMLAWSIATQGLDAPAARRRSTRRRRQSTTRAHVLGRTGRAVQHRA